MALFDTVSKHVSPKNLHLDKKSYEKALGRTKPKYKLAGKPLKALDQFVFFVCSGHSGAFHKKTLVVVAESEWLNRNPKFAGDSFIDISRCEVMTSREVGLKITDTSNGFKLCAELPDNKFSELQSKLIELRRLRNQVPRELKRTIAEGLDATPEIMKKLGI